VQLISVCRPAANRNQVRMKVEKILLIERLIAVVINMFRLPDFLTGEMMAFNNMKSL
jgi:hypothetical protein